MKIGHIHGGDLLLEAREELASFCRNSSGFDETDEDLTPRELYKLARARRIRRQDTAPAIEAMSNEHD